MHEGVKIRASTHTMLNPCNPLAITRACPAALPSGGSQWQCLAGSGSISAPTLAHPEPSLATFDTLAPGTALAPPIAPAVDNLVNGAWHRSAKPAIRCSMATAYPSRSLHASRPRAWDGELRTLLSPKGEVLDM